jgi:hypothetical protein
MRSPTALRPVSMRIGTVHPEAHSRRVAASPSSPGMVTSMSTRSGSPPGRTPKHLREKAGKSLGQLAEETSYDKSHLSRLDGSQGEAHLRAGRMIGSGRAISAGWSRES